MERALGPEDSADPNGVTWQRSPCLGQCDRAPAAMLASRARPPGAGLAPFDRPGAARRCARRGPPTAPARASRTAGGLRRLRLLRRVGLIDPGALDAYRADGGYARCAGRWRSAREGVIRELKDAKLLGRGGAAFPTAVKWEAVAANPSGRTTSSATPTNPSPARSRTGC